MLLSSIATAAPISAVGVCPRMRSSLISYLSFVAPISRLWS